MSEKFFHLLTVHSARTIVTPAQIFEFQTVATYRTKISAGVSLSAPSKVSNMSEKVPSKSAPKIIIWNATINNATIFTPVNVENFSVAAHASSNEIAEVMNVIRRAQSSGATKIF